MEDRFRVSRWSAEKRITNFDAEGLSKFRTNSSNSFQIWCATDLTKSLVLKDDRRVRIGRLGIRFYHMLSFEFQV